MRNVAQPVVIGLALVVLFSRQGTGGEDRNGSKSPVRLPGGVVGLDYHQGFVAGASGGIDAIELESGRLMWTAETPAEPLIALEDRLVAKTAAADKPNALRIVVLSIPDRGKSLLESDEITFPDWVSITPAYGQTFSYQVQVADDALLLKWDARARYAGGAPPPPDVEAAAARDAAGIERIDLRSGRTERVTETSAWPRTSSDLPVQFDNLTSHPYWTGTAEQTRPLVTGNSVATLAWESSAGQDKLTLRRWNLTTEAPLDDVVLAEGAGLSATASLDGRHLLVHPSRAGDADAKTPWWVFSLETGTRVGTLAYEADSRAATVAGSRVYYAVVNPRRSRPQGESLVQPQVLKAAELVSGRQLWERPIQGLRTLRPLPPRP